MEIEDLLSFVILAALTLGIVYLLTAKFLEVKVTRKDLGISRDNVNMLQALLTSSEILMKGNDGFPERMMINSSKLREDVVKRLLESSNLTYPEYEYKLEIFADGNFQTRLKKFDFVSVDVRKGCYWSSGAYSTSSKDSPALLCEKVEEEEEAFCRPVIVRLSLYETPLSQLSYWITKLCKGYENVNFEKFILLNLTQLRPCGEEKQDCGIKVDPANRKVCIHFSDGSVACKKFSCEKVVYTCEEAYSGEEECTSASVVKTPEGKIVVKGPFVWGSVCVV